MTKQELAAKIEKNAAAIEAAFAKADTEKRALTAEERTEIDRLQKDTEQADAEIKTLEADEKLRADNAIRVKSLRESAGRKATADKPIIEHTDDQGRVVGTMEATDEEISLRFGESRDAVQRLSYKKQCRENARLLKSSGYQPWGEFKSVKDFVRSGFDGHSTTAFRDRAHKHFAAVNGMSEGIGSDGGYMVMPEFGSGIIDRVYGNSLWGATDNYTVTGNNITFLANAETSRANGSRHGGLRGYWMAEGGSITSSKPTLREVNLKLVKLGVVVYLTQELIDDGGSALQTYVGRKAAEEFNFMIGDSLFNGTGVGQPLGVLSAPSLVSVAKESGQAAATIVSENIIKMYSRFYAPNLGGATWYHNQDISPQLQQMSLTVGTGGQLTYLPPGGLASAPNGSLQGRPLQPTEFNATLGTVGDLVLADLGQMLSISKGGVAQAVSMHVQFLTDQMALRFVMRLNAGPWESAPITPYKGTANTQASFISLDTRS